MSETKTCKQCNQKFTVDPEDLEFYNNISPTFNGKKYQIPAPTLCPECRDMRRFAWRNERSLYQRKCDKTGKDIISMYAPNSEFIVWDKNEWHKDDWDPTEYGRDYALNKSFFKQFYELTKIIPHPPITLHNDEGCDFCNFVWDSKNCYLCFATRVTEDCMYSARVFQSKNCIDCQDAIKCEYCFECVTSSNCYKSQNCERCIDCSEAYFSYDCRACSNIFMCVGLRNKKFYIRNKEYPKEEYFELIADENLGSRGQREELSKELKQIKGKFIFPENYNIKCENCTGDYLIECKNCTDCYSIQKSEDCKHIRFGNEGIKNSYDLSQITNSEYCYEIMGGSGYKNIFCPWPISGDNNFYCNFCENCSNCFGCFGLKHKKFCILNKQYSEDEYNKLVPKIIEKMSQEKEWGEFFPLWASPFAYNETMANSFYPLSREKALSLDAKWQDEDFGLKYEGKIYQPEDSINEYKENESKRAELLGGIMKCEKTGLFFRVLPQELAFYLENQIPVPVKHYDTRFKERFSLINPRKLHHRQCMCEQNDHGHVGQCRNEFETTYSPDRPEKVYCETCYQKSIL